MTTNGPLVVELLTRAHRLGFVLEYRPRAPQGERTIACVAKPTTTTDELLAIERQLRALVPDVVEVLARTCTVRHCTGPTHVREYGTDLPWCARHAGVRGLQLLHEEHPDLFPDPTDHTSRPPLDQETRHAAA